MSETPPEYGRETASNDAHPSGPSSTLIDVVLVVSIIAGAAIGLPVALDMLPIFTVILCATTVVAALLGVAPFLDPPKDSDAKWVHGFNLVFGVTAKSRWLNIVFQGVFIGSGITVLVGLWIEAM